MLKFLLTSLLFTCRLCEGSSDPFNADAICKALETNYYVSLPSDLSRSVIDETIDAFLAFANSSQEIKNRFQSQLPGNHRRRELGFVHREGLAEGRDTKDFFHYHPYLKKDHESFIAETPVADRLARNADIIWNHAADMAKKILLSLDSDYPGVYDKVFDTPLPHIVLRIVYYEAHPEQEILAIPHFDAGSFTLALAESAPGLRIGSRQENLKLVPHQEGRAIFMLGAGYRQTIATETLLPGWHDVIRLDNLTSRWAIVAFIDGHDIEGPSKEDTHKLSQASDK